MTDAEAIAIEASAAPGPAAAPASELAIERLRGRTLVVKYGGAAMGEDILEELFAADAVRLAERGVRVVVVHGGGNEMTALASALGIEAEFVGGHRRTSAAMLDVATMVLAGKVNKNLVRRVNMAGGAGVGICGVDGNLFIARKLGGEVDLGHVGEVATVNTGLLDLLTSNAMIPVIAPVGIGADGALYNINADLVAGAVAGALGADALVYMSNIEGIEADGALIGTMTRDEAQALIARGAITGGMLPKVSSAFAAIDAGVRSVRIADGRKPNALMMAAAGRGGTEVRGGFGGMKDEG